VLLLIESSAADGCVYFFLFDFSENSCVCVFGVCVFMIQLTAFMFEKGRKKEEGN
jgi:hypothetical protein